MRQSNTYIILFSAGMTIILGGLLAFAATGLGPKQAEQIAIDTRQKILSAVMDVSAVPKEEITGLYEKRISSLVVNIEGEVVEADEEGKPLVAENIDVARQFKKPPEERFYPVFTFMDAENPDQISAYIFPVYGNGLWDNIWGYVAFENDLNTIKGIVFSHAGETPGLGARITSPEVQSRYEDKTIYNEAGELVSVTMVKGETGNPENFGEHEVDGMAGATITANGVNNMLENYLGYYQAYIKKVSSRNAPGSASIK